MLLKSLLNKKVKGLLGDILVQYSGNKAPDMKLALTLQHNQFFFFIVCQTAILLSSKLWNGHLTLHQHKILSHFMSTNGRPGMGNMG